MKKYLIKIIRNILNKWEGYKYDSFDISIYCENDYQYESVINAFRYMQRHYDEVNKDGYVIGAVAEYIFPEPIEITFSK